jgi:hypothetical protein
LRFKKSLNWIEISTLREAESQFALLSSRDNFDPNKRNMAYFYAIARNLQRQKDQELKKQIACRRYGLDKKSREKRQEIRQAIVQHRQSKEQPYLPIIQAVTGHITLPQQYRATVTLFKALINEGIESLLKLKKATQQKCFDKTFEEIMALSEFPLETRYEMVDLVKNQMGLLTKNAAEVVTPN